MEIHKGTVATVEFYLPTEDAVVSSATYRVGSSTTDNPLTVTTADGVASAALPYQTEENVITVTWNFIVTGSGTFSEVQEYDVITPYLTVREVKAIWPTATDEQAVSVEAAVRHIINAHTGQSFGYADKTLSVEGHGEIALRLPERLTECTGFSTLSAELDPRTLIIVSDGWYIKKGWSSELSTIENDSLYWNGWDVNNEASPGEPGYEKPSHGIIITPPSVSGTPTRWRDDYPFKITGKWGYKNIPAPVKEAAKLLTNDYACSEALYRDRYLESIKAADWRMQFSSRAWEYTGNVRADQLLSQYVLLEWAVF